VLRLLNSVGTDLTGTLAAPSNKGERHGDHGDSGEQGESEGNETRLSATLADPTGASMVTGMARFQSEQENGTTLTNFRVNVKGATAGASLDVAIDGVTVGTITADVNGNGSLFLSSNTNNAKASPLPANFPTVGTGLVVTVGGTVTGTLTAPSHHGHAHGHGRRHG